ncbi:hypothetical protein Q4512_05515 [Oceanihabitans sp. 2_MG-2023]|uniref:hypothetical protein n=1 Tax=Oceanihabitans sp. 2_MG-2023 TaxID=3062661 RepID=UPI0026E3390E|nr:hypothetical protein [Oceanihabitans sp. 2_MG-2023]MDO6596363.1 hypothetical protein [Oceanihabitans sp. 2_MG-2023]
MKNLHFIYIIVMVSFTINISAQTKSTNDIKGMQKELAETLNSMLELAKPYYKEGDSYIVFKKELYGTSKITPISKEGEAIIKKVFYYLSNNTSMNIVLEDSGKVIYDAINYMNNSGQLKKDISKEQSLFGIIIIEDNLDNYNNNKMFNGCCFFCFRCHVLWALNGFEY